MARAKPGPVDGTHEAAAALGTRGDRHAEPTATETDLVRLFEEIRDELTSTLWFLLGNAEEACDVTQEVFLKCWRARSDLPTIRNVRAWVFRIAVNAARDRKRSGWHKHARRLDPRCDPAGCDSDPQRHLEQAEMLEMVQKAILELREEEREVFLLRQNGELTYEEIAAQLQRPIGTVKTQMRSALSKLRHLLTQTEQK